MDGGSGGFALPTAAGVGSQRTASFWSALEASVRGSKHVSVPWGSSGLSSEIHCGN